MDIGEFSSFSSPFPRRVANANDVNCGPVTGNCRRCSFTMPCVCDRLNGAAQANLPLHYKYTWQDDDGVMEESAVQ